MFFSTFKLILYYLIQSFGLYLDTVEVGLLHGVTVEEQKSGLVWTCQRQWQLRRPAAATADFYPHTLATQYPAKYNISIEDKYSKNLRE